MATIEERAKAVADKHTYINADTEYNDVLDACIEIATKQDRIARQEVYREIYAWLHYEYNFTRKKAANVVDDVKKFCFEHAKSMKEE